MPVLALLLPLARVSTEAMLAVAAAAAALLLVPLVVLVPVVGTS